MTAPGARAGLREIARWWLVVLLIGLIAAGASLVQLSGRIPTYSAAVRLVVTPLAQWDETFVGTSLIRDAGDASRTPATVAELLEASPVAAAAAAALGGTWTPEAVAAAVEVGPVDEANLVEIVARADDPGAASALAEAYATAAIAQRWQTISAELDARISAIARVTPADPNAGAESQRLQLLRIVRDGGVDPTLQIATRSPAVPDPALPPVVVVGLAGAGGLLLGLLVAVAAARLLRAQRAGAAAGARPSPVDPAGNGAAVERPVGRAGDGAPERAGRHAGSPVR